ncbi:MAG: hypothetical protein HY928_09050 [Elusimicrobia bacterium]|nr:hypothetical protein [Elusimicrobiota bacterium]
MSERLKVGRHTLEGTKGILLLRFRTAIAQDKAAEKSYSRQWKIAVLLALLAVGLGLSLTGRWATKHRHRRARAVVAAIAGASALGFLGAWVKAAIEKSHDLDDAKLAALKRFLEVAGTDMPKDAPLSVDVDFRGYKDGGTVVGKEGGLFSSIKTYRYRHDWLSLSGSFADGNRFRLQVTDRVTRKEKSKRKYTKVRESRHSRVRLVLSVKDRWGGAAGAAAAAAAGKVGPHRPARVSARGRILVADWNAGLSKTMTGRYGSTTGNADGRVTADDLLGSLVWTYAALQRTRPQAA